MDFSGTLCAMGIYRGCDVSAKKIETNILPVVTAVFAELQPKRAKSL